jgi:hypothetical protein
MEIIEFIFLPIILIFGATTTFFDLRYGKIRNKHLACVMLIAIITYTTLFFLGVVNSNYLGKLSINFILSLFFSILLWQASMWSAADAKLFSVYSFLVPLTFYSNTYIKFFPSIVLLINTFVPFFIYAFIKGIFATSAKQKKDAIGNTKPEDILLLALSVFWISGIPKLMEIILKIRMDFAATFIFIFLLYMLLRMLPKKRFFLLSVIFCIVRAILDYKSVITWGFFKSFAMLFLLVLLIIFAVSISSIKFTKKLHKKRKLHIEIEQSAPFSPFMLMGVLLTLIARGNFLLLANYLR